MVRANAWAMAISGLAGRPSSASAMPRSDSLRALYVGAMAGFQVPAGALADRIGGPVLLALGTALAGIGYLVAGIGGGFAMLIAALVVSGLGSSVQHPIGANLVARAFAGRRSRNALAGYNFSGDLGKMAVPAATAWLVVLMPWRSATLVLGASGSSPRRRSCCCGGCPEALAEAAPADFAAGRRFGPRLSAAAVDRDDRQRDAHGVSDLPAVPAQA